MLNVLKRLFSKKSKQPQRVNPIPPAPEVVYGSSNTIRGTQTDQPSLDNTNFLATAVILNDIGSASINVDNTPPTSTYTPLNDHTPPTSTYTPSNDSTSFDSTSTSFDSTSTSFDSTTSW